MKIISEQCKQSQQSCGTYPKSCEDMEKEEPELYMRVTNYTQRMIDEFNKQTYPQGDEG